uniref:Microsomal glutathione S-transferase 1 n=1 Tax=Lygus hesperus TaxID=30085 RepID=A0A0A9XBA4_LYGHE
MASESSKMMSLDNPVFRAYLFYCCVLVLKVLGVVALIGRQRFTKKIFRSPEDCTILKNAKVKYDDPDIERPRRAHLNDLENIPFFFVAAFAYMLTNPNPWLAINLFRAFTFARIAHTFVYAVVVIPQPARVISWGIGYAITIYMAIVSIRALY